MATWKKKPVYVDNIMVQLEKVDMKIWTSLMEAIVWITVKSDYRLYIERVHIYVYDVYSYF